LNQDATARGCSVLPVTRLTEPPSRAESAAGCPAADLTDCANMVNVTMTGRAALDDRVESALRDLDRDGFAVGSDALPEEEIARVRSRLVDVARIEREAGIDQDPKWVDGPENQRVFGLLNKGAEFVQLVEHPVVLALMEHLLDAAFLLSSITANITGP